MKKLLLALAIIGLSAAGGWSAEILGKVKTDLRISPTNGDIVFYEISGNLKFDTQVNDNFYGMIKLGFRYSGQPKGQSALNNILIPQELAWSSSVMPLDILIDEAYFTYDNFIFDGLEFTVGKQRIVWGTADVFNPTDIVNPGDFYDLLSFGKKSASIAVNTTLHFNIADSESGLQFVYQPQSPIAQLNLTMIGMMESAMSAKIIEGILPFVTSFSNHTSGWTAPSAVTPELSIYNASYGLRYKINLGPIDLSVNAVSRINDLPYVKTISIQQQTVIDMGGGTTNITLNGKSYELAYYREAEAGLDFSWNTGLFVLWGEAGVTFPENTVTVSHSDAVVIVLPVMITNNVTTAQEASYISNQPYVKYTIGADCLFEGGWYINFQFAHGFFTERGLIGAERLQDYFILRFEKTFLDDKIKLFLTGILNVNTLGDAFESADFGGYFNGHYGAVLQFGVTYKPTPGLELTLGSMLFDGAPGCTVGQMKDYDLIYTSMEYAF
jgi:hypothetical protein